jgi:hypothetical protein
VEDLYNIFYRSLSIGGHCHSLRKGDGDFDLAVMHMQGVGAIAVATGHSGVRWLSIVRELTKRTCANCWASTVSSNIDRLLNRWRWGISSTVQADDASAMRSGENTRADSELLEGVTFRT